MTSHVALLRGIGPGNPQMRNDRLREAIATLGVVGVQTVMSSGNVLFECSSSDRSELEAQIETAIEQQLGFTSSTVVRDWEQLEALIDAQPFGDLEHSRTSYLLVTFLKHPTTKGLSATPRGDIPQIVRVFDDAVCTVTDATRTRTPQVMAMLERHYGKQITSRTWNTVQKITKRMPSWGRTV